MKISTKGWLVSAITMATIVLVGAMAWWAHIEVRSATHQRQQTAHIGQALRDMSLVTFEFMLLRLERARAQEELAWRRVALLTDATRLPAGEDAELLADLRERSSSSHRLFGDFVSASADRHPDPEVQRRFEAQLASRLLLLQQEALTDASRLSERAAQRIEAAQQRMLWVVLGGLLLFALATAASAVLVQRSLLRPLARLDQATRELAAGHWHFRLDTTRHDEIGELSRRFDAMTRSLRESFGQVERSNQELTALNRELESFSYSVSHDLRAPLRTMDGFSLALLEDYAGALDDEAQDYLHRIRAASQRMGRLIDDLLALSRVTRAELSLRPVDLSAMAREISAALARQHPARQVRCEVAEGMVVLGDRSLLHVALQNLLDNAWKFTSNVDEARIQVNAERRDGEFVCRVADNGAGFDMAYVGKLFGAFQRLHHDTEFPGTGIGLATVQRIVRRLGGQVWVQAEIGKGATFFFTLKEATDEQRQQQDHPAG